MKTMRVLFAGLVLSMHSLTFAAGERELVRVQPREIDDLLNNPFMGWQTFMRFADEDPNLKGLPSSTAYFRWYWKDVESQDGETNHALFDEHLAHARRAGQKLAFRVMTAGTSRDYDYSPPWIRGGRLPGFEYRYEKGSRTHWVPDLNDLRVLERHLRLIRSLGERYDGHRDLALVDIGSVGLWGEWHMSGTGVEMPTTATRRAIVDAYLKSFRRTSLVMLIGPLEELRYATRNGAGWRADCLGDMGGFSKTWNHMEKFYPQQIRKAEIGDVWRQAPVAFESCWDIQKWVAENWSVRQILDWAIAQHASYMNNKSQPLPDAARPLVEDFLRLMGYRYVIRSVEHAQSIKRGEPLEIRMAWENVAVAPCYADYHTAIALVDGEGKRRAVRVSQKTVRECLPGKFDIDESIAIPADLQAGEYAIQAAIVDPETKEPTVRLAIAGRLESGWYPLSLVDVR